MYDHTRIILTVDESGVHLLNAKQRSDAAAAQLDVTYTYVGGLNGLDVFAACCLVLCDKTQQQLRESFQIRLSGKGRLGFVKLGLILVIQNSWIVSFCAP